MENEFEFDVNNFKSLEEFFSKEINTKLSPQEMMITSLALHHVANVLIMYNHYSNIAVFDVKTFTKEHPEFANIDFNNLKDVDKDTLDAIDSLLHGKTGKDDEEFNKGDILIKNIVKSILSISIKLYTTYTKEYTEKAPEDTEQFFTILENCLAGAAELLKEFFTRSL